MNQLSNSVSTQRVITVTAGAAGTSDITSSTVDTANAEGVRFIVQMGAIVSGAVTSIKVQHSDTTTSGDFVDVAGTAQTIADDDDEEVFISDIHKPTKRYVRLIVDRGTQNATCSAIAEVYGLRTQPATDGTGVTRELFAYPASGTA